MLAFHLGGLGPEQFFRYILYAIGVLTTIGTLATKWIFFSEVLLSAKRTLATIRILFIVVLLATTS